MARAKIAAWALIVIFCVYRIATFTPQPLDGPHTLRPILNSWFDSYLRRYQSPEAAFENWRAWCLLALLVAPVLAALNFFRDHGMLRLPDRAANILCSRWLLFSTIAATLLLCRYPTLVDYQLNPDEGQFLAAAHKLFYEPNYFDSVDCGTSGPLNIYPLMLPAIVGFSPDYASSRILVLLVAFGASFLFYRTIRLLAPDSVARIAIMPLVSAFAVFENANLVHYNSEEIPVLLVSLTLFLAVRVLCKPESWRVSAFLLGLLVSAGFFAKMQSVPIIGAIGAVAIAYLYRKLKPIGAKQPAVLFIAGILSLQLLNAAICLATGVWNNFWMTYIVTNQRYADIGTNFVTELPGLVTFFLVDTPEVGYFLFMFVAVFAAYAIQRLRADQAGARNSLMLLALASAVTFGALMTTLLHAETPFIAAYVVLLAIFGIGVSAPLIFETGAFGTEPVRWFGLLSVVATCAAVFSAYRPHRPFPGYLFFLFVPVAAVMAWTLIRRERESDLSTSSRFALPLLFVVLALTHATFLWGTRNPHKFRTTVATIRQSEGDFIRSLTSPKGQIFVWGWTVDPYLGSGRVTATRDLNLAYQFMEPEEVYSYYRQRLLNDLSHNPPELIIDAISTDSWYMDDPGRFGLDKAPEIARFVSDFYRHLTDAYGQHFFLRADLMPKSASVQMPKACAPAAVRCMANPRRFYGGGMTTPITDDLPAIKLPSHALIEIQFTPFGRQTWSATIVNNEAVPNSLRGFRFQNIGGDQYRLLIGTGDRWMLSNPISLADSKPVWLSIELAGTEVRIQANGKLVDTMHLPVGTADTPGPITLGSWINGACRFSGTIEFFQIVDLDKAPRG
jgi:hypothetical protein